MNPKLRAMYLAQARAYAGLSNCPRAQFGALIVHPRTNAVVSSGYNGGPRGGPKLCGEHGCLRSLGGIQSGHSVEVGCVHAEMNAITNASRVGASTEGCWLFVNGEPCLMCAKLIHHAGIARVVLTGGGYAGRNGVQYLRENGVDVDVDA